MTKIKFRRNLQFKSNLEINTYKTKNIKIRPKTRSLMLAKTRLGENIQ